MKKLLIALTFLVPISLFSQEKEKPLESKIEKVTVFYDGAQITRKAGFQLEEGSNRLVIKGLSSMVNPQSIQVRTDADLIISGVEYRYNYLTTDKPEEAIEALTNRQKEIRQQIEQLQSQLSVYSEEENLIKQNESLKGQNATLQALEIKAAADFLRLRLGEIRTKQLDLQKSIRQLNDEAGKIVRQMGEINLKKPEVTGEICINVNAKQAITGDLVVNYFTSGASWTPNYDIRVKDIVNPVKLVQKADVQQKTGENWNKVKLTLSTGTPSLLNDKPKLNPWYLGGEPVRQVTPSTGESGVTAFQSMMKGRVTDRQTGEGVPFANVVVMSDEKVIAGTTTDIDGFYTIKPLAPGVVDVRVSYVGYQTYQVSGIRLPEGQASMISPQIEPSSVALESVVVTAGGVNSSYNYSAPADAYSPEVKKSMITPSRKQKVMDKSEAGPPVTFTVQQSNFEYAIDLPYKIPSDNKSISVVIAEKQIPAIFEYQTVPKIEKAAFLIARIPGWQEYQLISGSANLYFEGTFLGKSQLNVNTTEDTLQLSLGRDRNIVIDRVKVKEKSSTQLFSSDKKIQRGWEISVRNNRNQAIPIVIEDQIPMSGSDQIKVDSDISDRGSLDAATGKITWHFTIEPGQTRKTDFRYTVKCNSNTKVWIE